MSPGRQGGVDHSLAISTYEIQKNLVGQNE